MDPGQANVGAGGVLIFGVDGTLHRSPTPTRYYKPPLPLSSVRPSSAPPVLISDEPRLCRASPPPFKVCNLRIPWGRTHSNSLLCPAAAVLALSGIRPSALWVRSPRRAADPGTHGCCGGGITLRSRDSCGILARVWCSGGNGLLCLI
jgi:hypothetical protein